MNAYLPFAAADTASHRRLLIWVSAFALAGYALLWLAPPVRGLETPQFVWIHVVMETFAIVVAFAIFGVVWNAALVRQSGNQLVLACAFLAIGSLDLGHMLAFQGMPTFVTPNGGGKAIYFWLGARGLSALVLIYLALPLPWRTSGRRARTLTLFAALLLVAFVYWLVLTHRPSLPVMLVPGRGLTLLKIGTEYALVFLFGVAAWLNYRRARHTPGIAHLYMAASAWVMVLSEACFARYVSPSDAFSVVGHLYKVLAYGLVYRAILVETVRDPYARARHAEAEFRALEQRFRLATTAAQIGLWDWDFDSGRVYFSPQWKRQLGYADDELNDAYEEWESRLHPDDRAHVLGTFQAHRRTGAKEYEFEYRLRHRDGAYRHFLSRGELQYDEHDGCRVVGAHVDLTERVSLQKQALHAQKMQAIGQLTGGIAHDFNNILASIMGYADLALERCVPDPESKLGNYLREIQRGSERARDLVAKLLAFSRGGKGEVKPVQAMAPMSEVVQLLRSVVPSTIAIETVVGSAPLSIDVDPVHLHQMLMNLCINARDAIGSHGRIEIGVRREDATQAMCASCHEPVRGAFAAFWVTDDGQGITPEALAHVFEPFFSTKEASLGAGLGLATVHGLVHGYGGHVLIDSRPRQGTTVTLLLPVSKSSRAVPEPAAHARAPEVPAIEGVVLVVDDESAVARMVGEVLRSHGIAAQVLMSSQAALAEFRRDPARFAALITDYTMPDFNGLELIQALRALRADLPVILCSGFSDRIDAAQLQAHGIGHFLRKPVSNQRLLQALGEAVGRDAA